MAKAKTKKNTPKKSKKPVVASGRKSARRKSAIGLTEEQRASLLKPPADYDDALSSLLDALTTHRGDVRVPDLSAARLRTLARIAARAWEKEDTLRRATDAKLRTLEDARMHAEDAAWRAAL